MRKNVLTFSMVLMAFMTTFTYGQVGIGTMNPDKSAALDVVSDPATPLGALIPRMSEKDRDRIADPANGLLIFNTDEGCINSYDKENDQWNSLCGGVAKSVFTVNCVNTNYYGVYMEGSPLNSSNYLTVTVRVVKPGAYTMTATTENGYGFSAAGTFMNEGTQLVTLTGQGTPAAESSGDEVTFLSNGVVFDCKAFELVEIPVGPANPTYAMDCGTVTVNGTYISGTSLRPTNTITMDVDVTALGNGQWSAETNTVDGIFFSGGGVFTSTGLQTITLLGHGTPTSARAKTMTITLNSASIAKTCTATVNLVFNSKNIVTIGNGNLGSGFSNLTYGYSMNASASYAVAMRASNFGTPTSAVPMTAPLVIKGLTNTGSLIDLPVNLGSLPSSAQLSAILSSTTPPDILFIGWGMTYDATSINAIKNYLNSGGVVIIMNKYPSAATGSAQQLNDEGMLFSSIFGTTVTSSMLKYVNGTIPGVGTAYGWTIPLSDIPGDPVLNGPFNNESTLSQWGADYYPPVCMNGIPESQIIVYSYANVNGGSGQTGVSMFRHKSLNLFWVGDGGFLSNSGAANSWEAGMTANAARPFNVQSTSIAVPVPRIGWGGGVQYGGNNQTIYNSQLFANVLAWAIQQAENNGINVGKSN